MECGAERIGEASPPDNVICGGFFGVTSAGGAETDMVMAAGAGAGGRLLAAFLVKKMLLSAIWENS
jgi:hypothetical protein